MELKYSCFISYPSPKERNSDLERFVLALNDVLRRKLDGFVGQEVFFDRDGLKPGGAHQQDIANALCHSGCMFLVYVPAYGKNDYCLREFSFMEQMQAKRKAILGQNAPPDLNFIVPVSLVAPTAWPAELRPISRTAADFSAFMVKTEMGQRSLSADILSVQNVSRLVAHVRTCCALLETHAEVLKNSRCCDGQQLPPAKTLSHWGAPTSVAFPY
jgi:TIR domain